MKDHHIPKSPCPHCGDVMDMSLNAKPGENAKPKPGDIALCLRCNKISVFDENIKHRKPTPEELERALKMPELTRAQMAIAHITYNAPWNREKREKDEQASSDS